VLSGGAHFSLPLSLNNFLFPAPLKGNNFIIFLITVQKSSLALLDAAGETPRMRKMTKH
jgi:hypothetical protein